MVFAGFRVVAGAFVLAIGPVVLGGLVGCGKTPSTEAPAAQVCLPSAVYSCVRGSCNGHQGCTADGTAFTSCICNGSDDEPQAGAGPAANADAGSRDAETAQDAASPKDASTTMPSMTPDARVADAQTAAMQEQCDNGKDDDGDGQVDCADDDCADMACVAEAPQGWLGPIALRLDAAAGGSCPGSLANTAFEAGADPAAAAASCSACSCSGGDEPCAAFVDFGTGSTAACEGATCTTSINQSCAEIMPPCLAGLTTAYLQTKLPVGARACTPSVPTATKPAVAWKLHALACTASAPQRGGCKAAGVCLPKSPGSAFVPNYCIWHDGETDCPASTFTDKRTYYREVTDTRTCAACACSGPNCSYQWQVFNSTDTGCTAPLLQITSPNQCVQVNPAADKLRVGGTIAGDGKCTPSGGASQGAVSAAKPVTVCCEH
jgi:hypothetical protein